MTITTATPNDRTHLLSNADDTSSTHSYGILAQAAKKSALITAPERQKKKEDEDAQARFASGLGDIFNVSSQQLTVNNLEETTVEFQALYDALHKDLSNLHGALITAGKKGETCRTRAANIGQQLQLTMQKVFSDQYSPQDKLNALQEFHDICRSKDALGQLSISQYQKRLCLGLALMVLGVAIGIACPAISFAVLAPVIAHAAAGTTSGAFFLLFGSMLGGAFIGLGIGTGGNLIRSNASRSVGSQLSSLNESLHKFTKHTQPTLFSSRGPTVIDDQSPSVSLAKTGLRCTSAS